MRSNSPSRRSVALVVTLLVLTFVLLAYDFRRHDPVGAVVAASASATSLDFADRPASLWIGDSYTGGTGAHSSAEGYPCLTATALHWVCNLDAEGQTGFINNGHGNTKTFQPMIDRLPADRSRYLADVVVIDGGRNDGYALPRVEHAIKKYVEAVRKAYPHAKIVEIVPEYLHTKAELYAGQLAAFIRQEMHRIGGYTVDPLAEGWMNRKIGLRLEYKDGVHPGPAGHRYIARHLEKDFRRFGLESVTPTDRPTVTP